MGAIKCYGIHFSLQKLEWDDFAIYGWVPSYSNWRQEPDEPHFVFNRQRGVYILQDELRRPLYIGRAGTGKARLGNRLWAHTRNHNRGRWTHFSWFGLDEPEAYRQENKEEKVFDADPDPESKVELDANASLAELEAILITAIDPPLNKRGGDWNGAQPILQWSEADDVSVLSVNHEIELLNERIADLSAELEILKSAK